MSKSITGKNIYLAGKEIIQLRNACETYIQWCNDDDWCSEVVKDDLYNGLGSALRKLFKGTIKEKKYAKYK